MTGRIENLTKFINAKAASTKPSFDLNNNDERDSLEKATKDALSDTDFIKHLEPITNEALSLTSQLSDAVLILHYSVNNTISDLIDRLTNLLLLCEYQYDFLGFSQPQIYSPELRNRFAAGLSTVQEVRKVPFLNTYPQTVFGEKERKEAKASGESDEMTAEQSDENDNENATTTPSCASTSSAS